VNPLFTERYTNALTPESRIEGTIRSKGNTWHYKFLKFINNANEEWT